MTTIVYNCLKLNSVICVDKIPLLSSKRTITPTIQIAYSENNLIFLTKPFCHLFRKRKPVIASILDTKNIKIVKSILETEFIPKIFIIVKIAVAMLKILLKSLNSNN